MKNLWFAAALSLMLTSSAFAQQVEDEQQARPDREDNRDDNRGYRQGYRQGYHQGHRHGHGHHGHRRVVRPPVVVVRPYCAPRPVVVVRPYCAPRVVARPRGYYHYRRW